MTDELVWPNRTLLVNKHRAGEILTSPENLALCSRTFYGPTQSLHRIRGQTEHDKTPYVTMMYLLDRWVDECEDGKLALDEKLKSIGALNFVLTEILRKEKPIEDILKNNDFNQATRSVANAILAKSQEEIQAKKTFVRQLGKGTSLREFYLFDDDTKKEMVHAVQTMRTGMETFLHKGTIKTLEDLDQYCYYVAGSVGEFLTKLVGLKDRHVLDVGLAKNFGKYLQITNIIKNIREDFDQHNQIRSNYIRKGDSSEDADKKANRIYIPSELLPRSMTYADVINSTTDAAKVAREKIFNEMMSLAKKSYVPAIDYLTSIPEQVPGYQAFCLAPFAMAQKTLEKIASEGPEKLFKGEPQATKMEGGLEKVKEIVYFCENAVQGNKTKDMLEELKKAA